MKIEQKLGLFRAHMAASAVLMRNAFLKRGSA